MVTGQARPGPDHDSIRHDADEASRRVLLMNKLLIGIGEHNASLSLWDASTLSENVARKWHFIGRTFCPVTNIVVLTENEHLSFLHKKVVSE